MSWQTVSPWDGAIGEPIAEAASRVLILAGSGVLLRDLSSQPGRWSARRVWVGWGW